MLCSEWALVKKLDRSITVGPLRCKCWTCDECRPRRTYRLIKEAQAGQPTLFVTLTSRRRATTSPDAAARDLAHAWRKVRGAYLRKHGPRSLEFLAVFEATKKGWPHLHIVVRAKWINQRWLSKKMGRLIGAPVVDVRAVYDKRKIAGYVSKYIGKNPHRFYGVKRYWRSLNYILPSLDVDEFFIPFDSTYEIIKEHWTRAYLCFECAGWLPLKQPNQVVLHRYLPP